MLKPCERSSVVEHNLAKVAMRVRFPSLAPSKKRTFKKRREIGAFFMFYIRMEILIFEKKFFLLYILYIVKFPSPPKKIDLYFIKTPFIDFIQQIRDLPALRFY